MKSGWHFVGKDKNPAGRHKKAEHFSEGTVLTQNKFMTKTIVAIFNQISGIVVQGHMNHMI